MSNPKSLVQYFLKNNVLKCWKFAYYASRDEILDEDEVKQYKTTWLHKHYLTVLEKIVVAKVIEDQDLGVNTEEGKDQSTGQEPSSKSVLRWNFPTMGKVFLDILENFVQDSTADTLQTLCKKERSFAGYWFESMFYEHHKKSPSPSLVVECETSPGKLTTKELCLESVISLSQSFI